MLNRMGCIGLPRKRNLFSDFTGSHEKYLMRGKLEDLSCQHKLPRQVDSSKLDSQALISLSINVSSAPTQTLVMRLIRHCIWQSRGF